MSAKSEGAEGGKEGDEENEQVPRCTYAGVEIKDKGQNNRRG
jgi:hypothetical protein